MGSRQWLPLPSARTHRHWPREPRTAQEDVQRTNVRGLPLVLDPRITRPAGRDRTQESLDGSNTRWSMAPKGDGRLVGPVRQEVAFRLGELEFRHDASSPVLGSADTGVVMKGMAPSSDLVGDLPAFNHLLEVPPPVRTSYGARSGRPNRPGQMVGPSALRRSPGRVGSNPTPRRSTVLP